MTEERTDAVLLERAGAVARITLNRPQAGNTVDPALAAGLAEAATEVAADPAVRCVVLTGAGKLFCGGGDIGAFATAGDRIPEHLDGLAGTLHRAVDALATMDKPLLTLVNGAAAGAGLSLAIAGDIVVAARSASFLAAYGSVGLTPDGGMSWLLPRLVGLRWAQQMILANRKVDAATAQAIGLVTECVEDEDLERVGSEWAARLCAMPTRALGAARGLLRESFDTGLADHLAREQRTIVAAGGKGECREGIAAFMERRKPDFAAATDGQD